MELNNLAEPTERLLTAQEAAVELATTESHVTRLAEIGTLPYFKVGRFVRFSRKDLDAFLSASRIAGSDPDESPSKAPMAGNEVDAFLSASPPVGRKDPDAFLSASRIAGEGGDE